MVWTFLAFLFSVLTMANDTCAAATVVTLVAGTPFTTTIDTTGNAADPTLAPACWSSAAGGNAAWFKVTSPVAGALLIDTHGSDYDTELVAYSGSCGGLTELDCSEDDGFALPPNNDGYQSTISAVPVAAGVPVYIGVADYDEAGGSLQLNILLVAAASGPKRVILENDDARDELQGYTVGEGRTAQGPMHAYTQPITVEPGIILSTRMTRLATRDGSRLYQAQYTGATAETGYAIQAYDASLQVLPYGIDICDGGISSLAIDAAGNVYASAAYISPLDPFIGKYSANLAAIHEFRHATITADSSALGVSPDGGILYYNEDGSHSGKVLRYDANAEAPLSDLATLPAADVVYLIFVAAHGDVIVVAQSGNVYRYTAAGALLSTAAIGGGIGSYGYALDPDDLSVWVFDGADLTHALIADGSTIETETVDAVFTDEPQSNGLAVMLPAEAPKAIVWLAPLADNTIVVFNGAYLGNGIPLRYDMDGNLVQSYPYDTARWSLGMYGMTATIDDNACLQKMADEGLDSADTKPRGMIWLAGHYTPEVGVTQPGILPIKLDTGEVLDPIVTISAPSEVDLTAGFTILGSGAYPSISGDPTDQGLPPKPTVSCGPISNLRTPQPNSGCNAGGLGSTPTYTGPSGSVPEADDPVGEATLTGKTDVLVWTEIQHTQYNDDGTETAEVLRYAHVDLDDTLRKEGRLGQAGTIEIASSDGQGNMKSTSASIRIFDSPGRPIATRRADRTRLNFNRDEMAVYAIADSDRRIGGITPKMLGRVLLYGDSSGTPVLAILNGVDHLFIEGGSFSPDKTMPLFRYPLGFYTNAPADLAGVVMPVIYGEPTDNSATDPGTGLLSERGKCTPHLVDPESSLFGELYGRFNNNLFASYLIEGVFGSDCGGLGCWGMSAVSDGKKPNSTVTLTGRGDFSVIPAGGWAQLVPWTANGRSEHRIIKVNIAANSVKVEGYIDPAIMNGPVDWMIERIDHAPRRVKIDIADRQGFDVMIPGYAGYTRPTTYEDFTDPTDGRKWRVTDFGIRGPLLREHLGGGPTIATNTIGIEDQGDGSGLPIVDGFVAFCHWWDNCVHQQNTVPPVSDNLWAQIQADLPAWSDGLTKTMQSSFAACQALTVASLGGYGIRIGMCFDEAISMRDALQLWNDNLGGRTVTEEHGRIKVWMIDRYADTSTWPRLDDVSRVFGNIDTPRAADEAMNVVRCGCDWDPDARVFRRDNLSISHAQAIRRNKGFQKPSKHYDFKMLTEPRFAEYRMNQILGLNKDGPIYVPIEGCDIGVCDFPIGTGIVFTSIMGPGEDGYVDHPIVIADRVVDLDGKLVGLLCIDVGTDSVVIPSARQFIATDNDSIAPVASNDADVAPLAAA